jgi:hypothetical protein
MFTTSSTRAGVASVGGPLDTLTDDQIKAFIHDQLDVAVALRTVATDIMAFSGAVREVRLAS